MRTRVMLIVGFCILTGGVASADDAGSPSIGDAGSPATGDASSGVHHKTIQKRLQAGADQTVNTSSIALAYSHADKQAEASKDSLVIVGRYAFGRTENGSWGIKLGVPFEYVDPGTNTDKEKASGLGDIQLQLNRSFTVTSKLRMSAALGARFNTATADVLGGNADASENEELGGGSDDLNLSGHASYHLGKSIRGKLSLKYEQSVHTDAGRKDVESLTPTVGVSGVLPYHLLWDLGYSAKFNLLSDSYKDSAKLGVRYLFGSTKQWSVDVATKIPVKTANTRYSLGASISRHL
jgi:hypothetical protein